MTVRTTRELAALAPTPPVSHDDAIRELYRVVSLLSEFTTLQWGWNLISQRWYDGQWFHNAGYSGDGINANRIHATGFYLPRRTAFDRIGIQVIDTHVIGDKISLGIYESDSDGNPAGRVLDGGDYTITVNTPTQETIELTIDITLPSGFYYLAMNADAVMTVGGFASSVAAPWLGQDASNSSQREAWIGTAQTYATDPLPDPFPTFATSDIRSGAFPRIELRVA